MKPRRYITRKYLMRLGACLDMVQLFEVVWPGEGRRVEVTEANARKALSNGFGINSLVWLAKRILSGKDYARYLDSWSRREGLYYKKLNEIGKWLKQRATEPGHGEYDSRYDRERKALRDKRHQAEARAFVKYWWKNQKAG